MAEYFQVIDSIKVKSLEVNIVQRVKDSIVFKLECLAYFSDHNRLDSILCVNGHKNFVTKYVPMYFDSGYIYKTTYYDKLDNSEMYRIEKFIYGKESSLEFLNSKNGKGYRLATIYDVCCTKIEQLWFVNDTLTKRQITQNKYDENFNWMQYCARAVKKTFNPYYSIYLYGPDHFPYVDDNKAGKFQEEYMGKQFISLSGDTIVITKTDSVSYLSQTKLFSNEALNYSELNQQTLNGFGTNFNIKWYDSKYSSKREDTFSFEGIGSDEGVKHHIRITNQLGDFDYEGMENTSLKNMTKRESNKKSYKFDRQENWVKGIFKKNDGSKYIVTRKIHYD